MCANENTGIVGITKDGYPIVTHTYTCEFWAPQISATLCPMRECWYCRYADFRSSTDSMLSESVCKCQKNVAEAEAMQIGGEKN